MQEPGRLPDGSDDQREFLRGGLGELYGVCTEDRRAFRFVPGDCAAAAAGVLHKR